MRCWILGLSVLWLAASDAAAELELTAFTGLDFSRGDYGETFETDQLSGSVTLKAAFLPVTLRATLPYLFVDGADSVVGDDRAAPANSRDRRHGLGDVTTSLSYEALAPSEWLPTVELMGKVKLPTASESDRLGTGHTDLTLQLEVGRSIGPVHPFAAIAYRIKGGAPDDIWLASAGASAKVAENLSLGIAYDWRQASIAGIGDSSEISPFASLRLSKRLRWIPYAVLGLSENSPDWGLGFSFGVDLY